MKRVILLLAVATAACSAQSSLPVVQPQPVQPPERAIERTIPMTRMIQRAFQAGTRDSTGTPGPNYWQMRVDYSIDASLDTARSIVSGHEIVTIHNNSPDTLPMIGLRLDQNIYAPNMPRATSVPEITDGMILTKFLVDGKSVDLTTPAARGEFVRPPQTTSVPLAYGINQTNARIILADPIAPGAVSTLDIIWHFRVPLVESGRGLRMGRMADSVYQIAQWYPRVMVYDDYRGWQNEPYLGDAEFNNNFGRFDVRYDVPAGWLVGSTGVLQNPADVLTATARARLTHALDSDSMFDVVSAAERGPGRATVAGQRLVWHFVADSVADVAWATSPEYVWSVTRATIPGKGAIPVNLLYPASQTQQYARAAESARHALQFYSNLWMPYAFPQLTLAYGPELGMEYPMFIMSGLGAADHETGHEWWPMMVGVNETWWGFMDEGFNQYMNILSANNKANRAPNAGLDSLGARYGAFSGMESEPPLIWNENYAGPLYSFAAYGKAPLMLSMLGGIVGDSAVWRAMSGYAHAWRFKKPTPWDFAFFMNNALGRDLGWFWRSWIFETEGTDGSIAGVTTAGNKTRVTVRQAGEMPSPVVLQVRFAESGPAIVPMPNSVMLDNRTALVTYPVDVWFGGSRTFIAELDFGGRAIERIVLDPHARFPDGNLRDNVWPQ